MHQTGDMLKKISQNKLYEQWGIYSFFSHSGRFRCEYANHCCVFSTVNTLSFLVSCDMFYQHSSFIVLPTLFIHWDDYVSSVKATHNWHTETCIKYIKRSNISYGSCVP